MAFASRFLPGSRHIDAVGAVRVGVEAGVAEAGMAGAVWRSDRRNLHCSQRLLQHLVLISFAVKAGRSSPSHRCSAGSTAR